MQIAHELAQSITILVLGIGLVFNGLAIRHLIKAVNGLNELMALALVLAVRR
jgi:Na+-transporting methylmalonyl-CoA/oxaloacetate decarboxylase gamma subunit